MTGLVVWLEEVGVGWVQGEIADSMAQLGTKRWVRDGSRVSPGWVMFWFQNPKVLFMESVGAFPEPTRVWFPFW